MAAQNQKKWHFDILSALVICFKRKNHKSIDDYATWPSSPLSLHIFCVSPVAMFYPFSWFLSSFFFVFFIMMILLYLTKRKPWIADICSDYQKNYCLTGHFLKSIWSDEGRSWQIYNNLFSHIPSVALILDCMSIWQIFVCCRCCH